MKGGTYEAGSFALKASVPLFVAEYAQPSESAAGNAYFLQRGATPIRCSLAERTAPVIVFVRRHPHPLRQPETTGCSRCGSRQVVHHAVSKRTNSLFLLLLYPICGTLSPRREAMMTKSAMIRARVDPALKEDAENVFEALGLSATQAITLFISR